MINVMKSLSFLCISVVYSDKKEYRIGNCKLNFLLRLQVLYKASVHSEHKIIDTHNTEFLVESMVLFQSVIIKDMGHFWVCYKRI